MKDTQLYTQILGISTPWKVTSVDVSLTDDEVEVHVKHNCCKLHCPQCNKAYPGYDHRQRRWRHLDTCQLKTLLVADVPRVQCPEHGVVTVSVPWAEAGSGFTALFEAPVIGGEHQSCGQVPATELEWRRWYHAAGSDRGLSRRKQLSLKCLSVDETAYRKGHDYITVVSDQEAGAVVHVSDDRWTESLSSFYETLMVSQKQEIEAVCMDMWPA